MKTLHKIELKNKYQKVPRIKFYFKSNSIYCGDCEKVLSDFPEECVDLIYIDPPFFSNKRYEVIWDDGYELACFEDRWKGGIENYKRWMRLKIEQIHKILKSTGSFYLHCDYHAGHYLKIICDDIFGYNNFQNEIIWHYRTGGISKRWFGKKHDTIFVYAKNINKVKFNPQEEKEYYKEIYGSDFKPGLKDRKSGHDEIGYYHYVYKDDVWDIKAVFNMSNEYMGYPTQKPERLLENIIKASSNPTDIVLDAFCGCGTTLAVAKRLGRQFIGIDVSPTACKIIAKRIGYKKREIIGMKYNINQLKELPHFEFQNWVCEKIDAKPNQRKVRDLGIDGIKTLSQYGANLPIEVKQHTISRPDVDKFETVLRRIEKKTGFMVGFKFSKGANEEIARIKNTDNLNIIPITVQELLEKENKIEKEVK